MADHATVTYPSGDQAERTFERIIGTSTVLESVLDQVEHVAHINSTVLIEGETGTVRTTGNRGCNPGRLTSDRDRDR